MAFDRDAAGYVETTSDTTRPSPCRHIRRRDQQNETDVGVKIEGTGMNVKMLATGAAAVAAIGTAAAGVTSVAFGTTSAFEVQPAALGMPFAQDPPPPPAPGAPPLPSPEQLSSLCNQVTDPGVSYQNKFGLVENGISGDEGHVADHDLRKAYRDGNFPEQYNVTNIRTVAPNAVSADVAITGPKFAAPVTKQLAFIDQGGTWVMQHDSAIALVQAATATG
jgi:hypothetical protein